MFKVRTWIAAMTLCSACTCGNVDGEGMSRASSSVADPCSNPCVVVVGVEPDSNTFGPADAGPKVVINEDAGVLFETDGGPAVFGRVRRLRGTLNGSSGFLAEATEPLLLGATYRVADRTVVVLPDLPDGGPRNPVTIHHVHTRPDSEITTARPRFPSLLARERYCLEVNGDNFPYKEVDIWLLPEDADVGGVTTDPYALPEPAPLVERVMGGDLCVVDERPHLTAGERGVVAIRGIDSRGHPGPISTARFEVGDDVPNPGCGAARSGHLLPLLLLVLWRVRKSLR